MSCPTLRHFQGAWLRITEQWGRRWTEEAKTSSLHKPLYLPADLYIKQLQCLVTLEDGWWYLTQVGQVQGRFIWYVPVCKLKFPQPALWNNSIVLYLKWFELVSRAVKTRKPVIDRLSNMNMNIFTEAMKSHSLAFLANCSILTVTVNISQCIERFSNYSKYIFFSIWLDKFI